MRLFTEMIVLTKQSLQSILNRFFQGLNCLLNSSNTVCYWLLNSLLCYTMLTKV